MAADITERLKASA